MEKNKKGREGMQKKKMKGYLNKNSRFQGSKKKKTIYKKRKNIVSSNTGVTPYNKFLVSFCLKKKGGRAYISVLANHHSL